MQENFFLVGQLASEVVSRPGYEEDVDDDEEDAKVSATAIKQKLLHIMATECYLNKALDGQHTVLRTDLEWFGPSLPHDSILLLLKFFGLPQNWLHFIKAYLRAPLRFKEDQVGEVSVRERGTPFGFALSALCGEAILFAMDYAVNQRAAGLFLYRIHDDLWLWDSDAEKCVAAWQEMKAYASLVGLRFNIGKTGSACVGNEIHPELPEGDIRWGFLRFDSSESRFIIDQADVDSHIVELQRKLSATKSVFGWVNAYNKYIAFFVRNFCGRPARCFGRAHVDDMVDTLARVQKELFKLDDAEGGAVGHLKSMIGKRFGVHDLPEGYFYFPIGSGGMELRNPMIELFATINSFGAAPGGVFVTQMDRDAEQYQCHKERWDEKPGAGHFNGGWKSSMDEFMPYEEYIDCRETRLRSWRDQYDNLLHVPSTVDVCRTPAVEAVMKGAWTRANDRWDSMDFYNKWVICLYAEELVQRFGSLEIVDPALIPVGMVQLFRRSRMKWDQ